MKIINRILSVLLVVIMLFSQVKVLAANTDSYDAGYDAGYDYAYEYDGRLTSGSLVYSNTYKDSYIVSVKGHFKVYMSKFQGIQVQFLGRSRFNLGPA
jgi:hypothetical protein